MKERDKALLGSWMGSIKLAGKELRPIGAGQSVLLKALDNACLVPNKEITPSDMVEIVMVLAMDRDEIIDYLGQSKDLRELTLSKFTAYHIDEIDKVIGEVANALERIGSAVMESDNVGKEIRHAS